MKIIREPIIVRMYIYPIQIRLMNSNLAEKPLYYYSGGWRFTLYDTRLSNPINIKSQIINGI